MLRQVQQEWKVQAAHNSVGLHRPVCKVQGAHSGIICTNSITHVSIQVWIKPNGEMPFLYGNHVVKAHLGRITEDTPEHQGVVVFSMSDVPLVSCQFLPFTGTGLYWYAGIWSHRAIYRRHPEIRSNVDNSIPPSRCGRIPAGRGVFLALRVIASFGSSYRRKHCSDRFPFLQLFRSCWYNRGAHSPH